MKLSICDMSNRTCDKCNLEKPLTKEFFKRNFTKNKDSFRRICKECEFNETVLKHVKDGKLMCQLCNNYYEEQCFSLNRAMCNKHRNYRDRRCKMCRKKENKERREKMPYEEWKKRIIKSRFLGARERAKRENLSFNITEKYINELFIYQNGKCALSNVEMTFVFSKGRTPTNISIDKIIPSLGYIKGNIQLVCMAVNQMKSDLTHEQLFRFCEMILKTKQNENKNIGITT